MFCSLFFVNIFVHNDTTKIKKYIFATVSYESKSRKKFHKFASSRFISFLIGNLKEMGKNEFEIGGEACNLNFPVLFCIFFRVIA